MTVLSDSIFAAAYGAQSPMGKSLYNPSSSTVGIQSFRHKAYGLNGAVLAATGINDHHAFVQAVQELLSESHVGDAPSVAIATPFLGGEVRINAPSAGMAHVALAFQGPKGATTPLFNIIQQCIELSATTTGSVSAYASSKTGLVGLYSASTNGSAATDALCSIMTTIPNSDVISRAKNLAKSKALFSIDGSGDSQTLAGLMTDSIFESGSFGYNSLSAAYDKVSIDQVQAFFTALGKSVPAFVAVGDLSSVPYHGSIATRFN